MIENIVIVVVLISPLCFGLTAISSIVQGGINPVSVKRMSRLSTGWGLVASAGLVAHLASAGPFETTTIGIGELGLSLRFDTASVMMFSLIALLGFLVLRYSFNYLEGDARHGAFLGRLAAAIASVQLLVLSGNLALLAMAWILTSLCLHRLLMFYPERIGARIAARKKFIMARLSDLCLIMAIVVMYREFNTGNLEAIFSVIKANSASGEGLDGLEMPAILIVLSALFKSVQFPFHGWLVEVMETPTPVSALLHAGILNAGPFLIIRFSYLMESVPGTYFLLITFGGATALFGSIVYLTQPSVKTALSYSSIAHMGFSLLLTGLGGFPAAMLHLMGHSFYKAHAFLSSGSAIDTLRVTRQATSKRFNSKFQILLGCALSLGMFAALSILFEIEFKKEPAIVFLGAIIVLGITQLVASSLGSGRPGAILRVAPIALGIALAFFALESLFAKMFESQVPLSTSITSGELILASTFLALFAAVVIVQILTPDLSKIQPLKTASIHLKNGLYVNAVLDRLIGAWNTPIESRPDVDLNLYKSKSKKIVENQTA